MYTLLYYFKINLYWAPTFFMGRASISTSDGNMFFLALCGALNSPYEITNYE